MYIYIYIGVCISESGELGQTSHNKGGGGGSKTYELGCGGGGYDTYGCSGKTKYRQGIFY